jgi:signal transduction histidine kinase
MHDIGKLGIPDYILNKPGKLTKQEFDVMKTHAEIGARILSGSKSRLLSMGATVALTHHERFDGSGYPKGTAGKDIPLVGRIVAIADVFDALMSKRSYKEAFSLDKTLEIMRNDSGTHFDPEILDLFLENVPELIAIHERYTDVETESVSAAFRMDHVANNVAASKTATAFEGELNRTRDDSQPSPYAREKAAWTREFAGQLSHELCNPAAFVDANLASLSEYFKELLSVARTARSADNRPGEPNPDLELIRDDIPALLAESRDGIRRMRRVVEDLQSKATAPRSD